MVFIAGAGPGLRKRMPVGTTTPLHWVSNLQPRDKGAAKIIPKLLQRWKLPKRVLALQVGGWAWGQQLYTGKTNKLQKHEQIQLHLTSWEMEEPP